MIIITNVGQPNQRLKLTEPAVVASPREKQKKLK